MIGRSSANWKFDTYAGGAWFICDRCSQRHRRSEMLTEWTGLKVDVACLDPRPPQMFPPDVYPEGIPFFDARPPQDLPDRFTDDSYVYPVTGGMKATNGTYPVLPNGQKTPLGGLSPQPVIVSPIPSDTPQGAPTDLVTLRTGTVGPFSINSPPDPSPGPVPDLDNPSPPF